MAFWIFMLLMALLVPVTMILFGRIFSRKAPGNINMLFGYRTERSMKNEETWNFAHAYFGRIWYRLGWILLPVSILGMLPVLGKDKDTVGYTGMALEFMQILALIIPICFTEAALKKNFDEEGRRILNEDKR